MLSVREVADIFHRTPQTIYSWVDKGILKVDFRTPSNRRYFSKEQINTLVQGGNFNEGQTSICSSNHGNKHFNVDDKNSSNCT